MFARQSIGRICALIVGLLSSLAAAQGACQAACNALIVNDLYFVPCGVDPSDPSLYGYYADWCDCGGPLYVTMTFTGTNGAVTTTATSTTGGGGSTDLIVTFPFNVPHTAIQSGSYVTHQVAVGGQGSLSYPAVSSISSPVQSIFYAASTQTLTSTATASTTVTTTATATATSTLAQSTTTSACTTGITTLTAPSVTKTITSTITFPTLTITVPKVVSSTTTVACITPISKRGARRDGLLGARQNNALVYETDYCPGALGPPPATTIYTDTDFVTTTTTATTTLTTDTTTTVTTTATPDPATTTVCSNVLGTTTVTPTKTRTAYRYSFALPVKVTKTYTKIRTKFPGGKPALCTVAPKPNRAPLANAPVMTLSAK